jgi:alkanesulfonate monooxygenase SsuD/methylene tetrahydromethanopterin reductase-like flavin-dependent oxidoreductase (luciferase family)
MEMVNPPGYVSPGSLRGMLSIDRKPFSALSYAELLADGYAVVGSPATVTARLAAMHEQLGGYGQLIGLFAIGPATREQTRRSTELFASEVMPALRHL